MNKIKKNAKLTKKKKVYKNLFYKHTEYFVLMRDTQLLTTKYIILFK